MARTYCLLLNTDSDEIVVGYFVDAPDHQRRVSKARRRWYEDIAKSPALKLLKSDTFPDTIEI